MVIQTVGNFIMINRYISSGDMQNKSLDTPIKTKDNTLFKLFW